MSALRSWLAEGTAQRWLTAAAVIVALGMIAGLVGVVLEVAGGFFWPHQLLQLRLADGSTVLGEPWGREPDPSSPGKDRVRLKVGNRDLLGADFRWIRESDVRERSTPANAWLVERREYGNFYGYPVRLVLASATIAASDPLFAAALEREVARDRGFVAQERRLLRRVDRLHSKVAKLMTLQAAAQRRDEDTSSLDLRLADARRHEDEATRPILEQLAATRERLNDGALLIQTADRRETRIPLSAVVRAIPANSLTVTQKVALYLDRWWEFLTAEPRESNTEGGIFPAIFGTALMVLLMTIAVVPLGVVTAVYLNEYAREGVFTDAVRLALANLAGVPSIVFGAFGLAFFVYTLGGTIDKLFFSDVLPTPTFGTGGITWASLTLALLTLPVVVVATEEGLQSVPQAVRDGARALGATRWQTLRRVVLPYAMPGILTGAILAVARGAGEVAPLMVTGVVKLAPNLPFDTVPPFLHLERKFMHLGFHIYDVGFQSPNVEAAKPMVYAAVLVLLVLVVVLNLTAIVLRNRLRRRLRGSAV
ncbi:MAG TPA: phosphate ABC transporter permease PstA [Thermoanaerobaculaceae bacterium]|nr:phosphate ABC transporter permease PstA [Thermoanaerobaculaceae bacterium]